MGFCAFARHAFHKVEIHTTHPRKMSSLNVGNIFDTSVSSLRLIILILCLDQSASNQVHKFHFIHVFTRSFHDQLIGNGVVVASSLSDR